MSEHPELRPGDEVPPATPSAGEDLCPECGGSGKVGEDACAACGGTGRVIGAVGGG